MQSCYLSSFDPRLEECCRSLYPWFCPGKWFSLSPFDLRSEARCRPMYPWLRLGCSDSFSVLPSLVQRLVVARCTFGSASFSDALSAPLIFDQRLVGALVSACLVTRPYRPLANGHPWCSIHVFWVCLLFVCCLWCLWLVFGAWAFIWRPRLWPAPDPSLANSKSSLPTNSNDNSHIIYTFSDGSASR